jgi:flagellar M-ring protein FliF
VGAGVIKNFWQGLGGAARFWFVAGAACIVALTAVAGWWLLRTDYQVLFADLTPQDAGAMTAELERQKIPYTVSDEAAGGGSTILVDKNDVYKTRIKLMGKDIPLHGAVGFELFNNSDFGMTEFAQKINYQRALQGELTRTILSLSEIRDARVLLALPEQGLFKQATSKTKASITVTMKPGQALRPEQVTGIQRLVAAAVPGIATQDVTIVDQTGVALTRAVGEGEGEGSSGRLDLKRDTENYLSRKASEVLERALGAGQALASVDVTLDMDRVQTTTEDVVAAPARSGQVQTGVLVRERESAREMGAPLNDHGGSERRGGSLGGSTQREVEYAVGRRVEQVMKQPGSIRRIHVVAVVKKVLDANQQEQIRRIVAASVGAVAERGDTVVVQSIEGVLSPGSGRPIAQGALADDAPREPQRAANATVASGAGASRSASTAALHPLAISLGLLLVAVATLGLWFSRLRRRGAAAAQSTHPAAPLSEAQRQAALAQVQAWIRGGDGARPTGEVS